MALDEMKRAYSRDEVREVIEARLKAQHDEASRLDAALRQGRVEGVNEVARRMLENGMDRETVSKLTGLPADKLP